MGVLLAATIRVIWMKFFVNRNYKRIFFMGFFFW